MDNLKFKAVVPEDGKVFSIGLHACLVSSGFGSSARLILFVFGNFPRPQQSLLSVVHSHYRLFDQVYLVPTSLQVLLGHPQTIHLQPPQVFNCLHRVNLHVALEENATNQHPHAEPGRN